MFTLAEMEAWSADETLMRVMGSLPVGWGVHWKQEGTVFSASVTDADGAQQWSGEQVDQKLLFLDCLGWLRVKDHKASNPMWRNRATEVPLHRPPISSSPIPDPPDLDPDEVASVYQTSR